MSDQFLETFLPGQNPRLAALREEIRRINIAHKNFHVVSSILLVGERGTGKSLLAEVIAAHLHWLRAYPDGSGGEKWKQWALTKLGSVAGMRRQTLTALPDELAESILFGHKRGSFTGAIQDRDGAFKSDGDVDLLLDEIGDASVVLQAKLLEVLQTGHFRPLGAKWGDEAERTQARVLAATNRNLVADVAGMRFRPDLLDRLSSFVLALPPLRESREQIPIVLDGLASKLSRDFGLAEVPRLDTEDHTFVVNAYDWPGNIRELEHGLTGWFVWGGTRSLRSIVLENAERLRISGQGQLPETEVELKRTIRNHLAAVSIGGAPPFESFGAFRRTYGDAGVEVLEEVNRTRSMEMGNLFTCNAASVQSQLSGWRKSAGIVGKVRRSRKA